MGELATENFEYVAFFLVRLRSVLFEVSNHVVFFLKLCFGSFLILGGMQFHILAPSLENLINL